jgi:hypothetical protein
MVVSSIASVTETADTVWEGREATNAVVVPLAAIIPAASATAISVILLSSQYVLLARKELAANAALSAAQECNMGVSPMDPSADANPSINLLLRTAHERAFIRLACGVPCHLFNEAYARLPSDAGGLHGVLDKSPADY